MALTKITPQMFDTSATAHDLNVDNGTFVVDGSASRVGIGKTNPSTLLDVNGTATATTFVGALTGNVTGNVTGTILTAAQTNITSLGTLTGLTMSGNLNLNDDVILRLGTSNEFQIYHTSSGNSIISETGSGDLFIDGNNIYLRKDTSSGEAFADFIADGAAKLYHNGSKKFETTANGISVTGTIDSTGTMTAAAGSNSAALTSLGSIELLRSAGNPYIDFKTQSSEDYDCRIQQDTNGLKLITGGQGSTGTAVEIDSSKNTSFSGSVNLGATTDGSRRFKWYNDNYHSLYYDNNLLGSSSADVITYYQNFVFRHQDATNAVTIGGSSGTISCGNISIPSSGITLNQAFGTGVPTITMLGTTSNGRAGAIHFTEQGDVSTAAIYSTDGGTGNGGYGGLTIATYQSDLRLATNGLANSRVIIDSTGDVTLTRRLLNTHGNGNVSAPNNSDHAAGTRQTYYDGNATAWYARGIESNTLWDNTDNDWKLYRQSALRLHWDESDTALKVSGKILPHVDNTNDLGSTSLRWRNIYTADLHLSNEGSKNDVDGTSGNWTIQEGETDLYIINNKSGKRYRFALEEID